MYIFEIWLEWWRVAYPCFRNDWTAQYPRFSSSCPGPRISFIISNTLFLLTDTCQIQTLMHACCNLSDITMQQAPAVKRTRRREAKSCTECRRRKQKVILRSLTLVMDHAADALAVLSVTRGKRDPVVIV
jgi:hypothetical protein